MKLVVRCFLPILCLATAEVARAEVCTTESHSINFVWESDSVNTATKEALEQCRKNPVTNNTECSENLACGTQAQREYTSGRAACYTNSHSIAFQAVGDPLSVNAMTESLLAKCRANKVTDNTECTANFQCGNSEAPGRPYPSGEVTCRTRSHDIIFKVNGQASMVNQLVSNVIGQCRTNGATDNTECDTQTACFDRVMGEEESQNWNLPLSNKSSVMCRTFSHNIDFKKSGSRSRLDQLTADVLGDCRQNPVTINEECSQNLRCR